MVKTFRNCCHFFFLGGGVWDFYSLWPQWQVLCFSSFVNMKKEVEGWEGSHVSAGVKRAAVASADISEITLTSFLLGVYPWVMIYSPYGGSSGSLRTIHRVFQSGCGGAHSHQQHHPFPISWLTFNNSVVFVNSGSVSLVVLICISWWLVSIFSYT